MNGDDLENGAGLIVLVFVAPAAAASALASAAGSGERVGGVMGALLMWIVMSV